MKIGELATLAGCQVETIRFYEAQKLMIPAERTSSNYRIYGPAHLERLRFIRHCRSLGLSLDEIRVLIGFSSDVDMDQIHKAHHIVDDHLTAIDEKIQELNHLKKELFRLKKQCKSHDHEQGHCALIDGLRSVK